MELNLKKLQEMKLIKFTKIFLVTLLSILLLASCANLNAQEDFKRPRYIIELLNGDNKELYGCALLINMEKWKPSLSRDNVWEDMFRGVGMMVLHKQKQELI